MEKNESALLVGARTFLTRLYAERHDARMVFHNVRLGEATAALAQEIAAETQAGEETFELVRLAGLFLPIGYLFDYQKPMENSISTSRQFLRDRGCSSSQIEKISNCIQVGFGAQAPVTDEERIVADAYAVSSLLRDTSERSALLRLERELVSGQTLTKSEWARQFGNLLLKVRLYTPFAQTQYEGDLFNALLLQRRIAEKAESRMAVGQKQVERPFQYLEEDPPLRGVLAFFRTGYRNHINLSAIADNKAHIMISVNSILISVLISAISYHNMAQTNPGVLLPVVIFLVTGLASLTFAVLAARPKVTMFNRQITDKKIVMKNMIFFGNFVHLKLEDYEEMLDEVFRDSELMYGNMSRDLYFLGQVLDKKYRYLTISYNIFMMGFVATVLTFLFTLFSR